MRNSRSTGDFSPRLDVVNEWTAQLSPATGGCDGGGDVTFYYGDGDYFVGDEETPNGQQLSKGNIGWLGEGNASGGSCGGLRRSKSTQSIPRLGSFKNALKYVAESVASTRNSLGSNSKLDSLLGDDEDESLSDEEDTADERRLYRAVRDAGRYAAGVSAVEVWILQESISADDGRGGLQHLVQPDGGWWRSPHIRKQAANSLDALDALGRIEDKQRSDYVPPPPQLPGTGLAGKLWFELQDEQHHRHHHLHLPHLGNRRKESRGDDLDHSSHSNHSALHSMMNVSFRSDPGFGFGKRSKNRRKFQQILGMVNQPPEEVSKGLNGGGAAAEQPDDAGPPLLWRDIHSLTIDPDQPTFLRLRLLEAAGFDRAAGVRFDVRGTRGVVIYLAGSDRPLDLLTRAENCAYMRSAADFIGAAAAMTEPRKRILAHGTSSGLPPVGSIGDTCSRGETKGSKDSTLLRGIKIWGSKCRGGDLQPPPPMVSGEAALTFFGAFITLFILAGISAALRSASEGDLGIILGPFGALMTLQYGLVMAPASQPRNVIYGLSTAVTIALLFSYIPEESLPLWVRVPLATATVISALVRLGITHPPAGAAALIVSSGGYGWLDLPLIVLGGMISITTATLINNMSERRQYPTYYHLGWSSVIKLLQSVLTKGRRSKASNESTVKEEKNETMAEAPLQHFSTCSGNGKKSSADKPMGIEMDKKEPALSGGDTVRAFHSKPMIKCMRLGDPTNKI